MAAILDYDTPTAKFSLMRLFRFCKFWLPMDLGMVTLREFQSLLRLVRIWQRAIPDALNVHIG